MMHPTVSTVAAKAAQREMERAGGRVVPYAVAESAITAALAALAPEIRTAVDVLIDAAQDAAMWSDDPGYAERASAAVMAARRDLLALLGIESAE